MKGTFTTLSVLLASTLVIAQTPAPSGPLTRHYQDGETLSYHMTATNEDWHYAADASGTAKKAANSSYAEEFRWTGMTSNGQSVTLTLPMGEYRQSLSLDPAMMPSGPDLSKVDPKMVGPILDLMTFYTDLWLVDKVGILQHAGDHFYLPGPQANSWADGTRVLVGKDRVDFDLNLDSIDPVEHKALVVVHHLPPSHPNLGFPAGVDAIPGCGYRQQLESK